MDAIYYFDIGNTRAKFWCVEEGRVQAAAAFAHYNDMAELLSHLPSAFCKQPKAVCGASVLDSSSNSQLASEIKLRWNCTPQFAKSSAHFGNIENAYRDSPESLGIDRWLGIIGLGGRYKKACLIGCGTALTCDVLHDNKHLGGYILPGLSLMPESLYRRTHGVRVEARAAADIELGTSTSAAVHSGVLLAIVALIERVVTDQNVTDLILTGGDAEDISRHLTVPHTVVPSLILDGLRRYFAHLA